MTAQPEPIPVRSENGKSWQVVATSVAGVGHLRAGLPCQDAHAFQVLDNGWLVAAVADGAGSAERSEVGASVAVHAALEHVASACRRLSISGIPPLNEPSKQLLNELLNEPLKNLLNDLLNNMLLQVREGLEALAEAQDIAVRDLACTLIVAIASEHWIVAVQVGDGAIIGLEPGGGVFAVTRPPDTEYANATTFLCSPDALATAQWAFVERPEGIAGLAISTDGLQRLALKLPEGDPHLPFFAPLFRFVAALSPEDATPEGSGTRQLIEFLQSPRITARADDDLTLLFAVPHILIRSTKSEISVASNKSDHSVEGQG